MGPATSSDGLSSRSGTSKLLDLTLVNASHTHLLAEIYNLSLSSFEPSTALQEIKKLIDAHNRKQETRQNAPTKIDPLTPPLTLSDTASLAHQSIGDTASTGHTEECSMLGEASYACEDETENEHGSKTQGIDPPNDPPGHTWNEFSLEEELEGIADAPAGDRAAMREELRAKKDALQKQLRESAEEKRRVAEQDGKRLQNVLRTAPVKPTLTSSEPQASATPPARTPTTPPRSRKPFGGDNGNEAGERGPRWQKYNRRLSDGDSESTSSTSPTSPKIICIAASPPRNVVRFGVEFVPQSDGHRRSVLVQNIPGSFTIHELLSHIRGGVIVSVKLLPEMVNLGRGQTAVIIFAREEEAEICWRSTNKHFQEVLTLKDTGIRASLLPLPTYPTKESLAFMVGSAEFSLEKQKQTRCLLIDNFPKKYLNQLCIELHLDVRAFPQKVQTLEEVWFEGNTLHMNFTSIREAVKAFEIAKYFHYRKYSMHVRFGADPCAAHVSDDWKLDSDSCEGLKSIIETVGLAAYSRSYSDDFGSGNDIFHDAVSAPKKNEDGSSNDADHFTNDPSVDTDATKQALPWTAELMKGLELL